MKTLENLIPKLLEKTSDGSLSWEQTQIPQKFQASIGKYVVEIWDWTSEDDGTEGVSLSIRPSTEVQLSDLIYFDKYSSRYQKLEELHGYARRSALKIDRMIGEVEKTLDDLFPF